MSLTQSNPSKSVSMVPSEKEVAVGLEQWVIHPEHSMHRFCTLVAFITTVTVLGLFEDYQVVQHATDALNRITGVDAPSLVR